MGMGVDRPTMLIQLLNYISDKTLTKPSLERDSMTAKQRRRASARLTRLINGDWLSFYSPLVEWYVVRVVSNGCDFQLNRTIN